MPVVAPDWGTGPRSARPRSVGCPSSVSSARTSKGTGCAEMSPMAAGWRTTELQRGDGSLASSSARMLGPGDAVDRDVRLGGAEGAAAAGHGADGQLGAFALDPARPRRGLEPASKPWSRPRRGRRVPNGAKRWIGLEPWPTWSSSGPATTRTARSTGSWWRGITGLRGQRDRGEAVAALGVAGRHHAGQCSAACGESAARRAFVPGHQQVPAGTRSTCAWAALGDAISANETAVRYAAQRGSSASPWAASRSSSSGWCRCSPT